MARRPCLVDGCWALTTSTYCTVHRPKDSGDRHRRSKAERGYDSEYQRNRTVVLRRDGWTCWYCGGYADTVDHVVPYTMSHDNTPANLVAACRSCNARKGDRVSAWG